jgi:uncharacterized protein YjbI with pentapeptide repeats
VLLNEKCRDKNSFFNRNTANNGVMTMKLQQRLKSTFSLIFKLSGLKDKTLWDFIPQLIAVLTVIAAFQTIYFQQEESNKRYQKEELTKYIDYMKQLLIQDKNPLRKNEEVQNLARVKTINTLEQLDEDNKRILLFFLIEANLINNRNFSPSSSKNKPIISLSKANLVKVKLPRVDLSGADLSGADLSDADLSGADLSGANLSSADLSGADLRRTRLSQASLRYADLQKAKLEKTDLTEARLREATLIEANLKDSDLNRANLVGVNLENANLENADLENADLIGANLRKTKIYRNTNLSKVKLLESNISEAEFNNVSVKNRKVYEKSMKKGSICGPHIYTYFVQTLNNNQVTGIRCLLKINTVRDKKLGNKSFRLVWYGEGRMNNQEYRHIGESSYENSNSSVTNIFDLDDYNPKNHLLNKKMQITIINKKEDSILEFQTKDEKGLMEKWTLAPSNSEIKYFPLGQPTNRFKCGKNFQKYKVYPILTKRRIEKPNSRDWGIRCVLPLNKEVIWFGTGEWEGKPYYHLGTKMLPTPDIKTGYGAIDLCGFKKGAYCYKVEGGLLELNHLNNNGYEIKKEWSEKWLK